MYDFKTFPHMKKQSALTIEGEKAHQCINIFLMGKLYVCVFSKYASKKYSKTVYHSLIRQLFTKIGEKSREFLQLGSLPICAPMTDRCKALLYLQCIITVL